MESSSDDSFAWTNASSDNNDSDTMNSENVENNNYEEESESGNSYKSKLHKQLFKDQEQQNSGIDEIPQKKKKRKLKEELAHNIDIDSPRKKQIKTEPESDIDVKKKKKKKSQHDYTEDAISNDYQDFTVCDLGHHNVSIKQEQISLETVPSKNPNNADTDNQHDFESDSITKKVKKRSKKSKSFDNIEQSSLESSHCSSENRESIKDTVIDHKDSKIEDMFSAEETVVEMPRKKKKKKMRESHSERRESCDESELNTNHGKKPKKEQSTSYSSKEFISEDESNEENIRSPSVDVKTYKKNTSPTFIHTSLINGHGQDDDSDTGIQHKINITNASSRGKLSESSVSNKHEATEISRISDRITFEDEEDSIMKSQQNISDENYIQSLHFKRFLKGNANLKPVSKLQKNSLITENDEVWALKFPYENDIASLKGTDLVLDGKCKIKCNGQTYDGTMDDDMNKIELLSYENNFLINSIPLTGTVRFCKKMRKAHFFDENIMVNNQTNFIHLPETKHHHPLFGTDYKKAIKIPALVAEYLKAAERESLLNNEKKTKKQKEKRQNNSVDVEVDLESTVKSETEWIEKKKKKRKRKHAEEEEFVSKKVKRLKHDPDYEENWESEKAIEENLFNF